MRNSRTEITKNNTKKAFDIVKKLTRGHIVKATVIEDKNGNTLTEKSKVVDRWREHCEELYNYKEDVASQTDWLMNKTKRKIPRSPWMK